MADVFDKEPISFIDQNEQFPILNEKVGLTYQQFKTLVENTNFLYNNLGLSSIEVGKVTTQFPSPGSFSDVIVEHNISYINGKPIDNMDFLFKLPTPRISASLTTKIVDESIPTGMTLLTNPIIETINGAEVTTGYEFEFHANVPQSPMYYLQYVEQDLSEDEKLQARLNIGAGTSSFSGNYNDLSNRPNLADVATTGDYNDLLNTPSAILYNKAQYLTNVQKLQARVNIGAGTSNFDGNYSSLNGTPTNLSDFNNDVGYLTNATMNYVSYLEQNLTTEQKAQARANIGAGTSNFNGNYNSLIGTPTNLSDFNNDKGFITLEEVPITDLSNYYTKEETNNLISSVEVDLSNYYTKTETDNLISSITIDLSDYYTKGQVDNLIANIEIDLSDYYTKTETNNAINTKFNSLSKVASTGSYNDLIDTPSIPTKTSDITNDSGFITNAVDNLVNYYTKTEIGNMFADNVTFRFVTELPTTGVSNIVYFVSNSDGTNGNLFDEYVWTNNAWELIGSASIDLSNYYTKTEINSLLPDMTQYYTKIETSNAINNKFNTLSSVAKSGSYNDLTDKPKNLSDFNNDTNYITNSVSTLTNYYNKTTIDSMISSIPTFDSSLYYTKTEISSIVDDIPYVSYETLQGLTTTQKIQARTNIGAGTSNFSGKYEDLSNKPTLSAVATSGNYNDLTNKPIVDTTLKDSTNAIQNKAVYEKFTSVDSNISSATATANSAYSTAQSASSTANGINTKLNSLTLVDNGDNSYTLKFTQDNVVVGTITIPTDQYIKSISQSTINNNVKFTWNKSSTQYPDGTFTLDLKPYVYTAGNGISTSQISDTDIRNKISVYLDTSDANNKLFFNSTTGGLNVDLSGYYTSTQVDNLLPIIDTALSTTSTNAVQNKVVTNELNNKVDKVSGKGLSTNDLTNTLKSNYDTAYSNSHTHSNKSLLDTYTQTETNLADAVYKKHTHSNKSVLDNTTASYTSEEKTKLSGIANGAEVNVQADWNVTDVNSDAYIKNKPNIPASVIIDDKLSTTSVNAVQNKVITKEIQGIENNLLPKKLDKIVSTNTNINLNKYSNTWTEKTWNLSNLLGHHIWTDGINIYYSSTTNQYVLNKSTSTWDTKTWSNLTNFYGIDIWTDGSNIYYSNGTNQYVLDKSTSTWNIKTWNGLTEFYGDYIWTDGSNIYYSRNDTNQYVLDKSTSTWTAKTWNGLTYVMGSYVWTDGINIYYSYDTNQYVLDKSTSTWNVKTWNGLTEFFRDAIWTDGINIYYSYGTNQYVLDKSTSTWTAKTWNGLTNSYGGDIWTDGDNIYFSSTAGQYVLNKHEIQTIRGFNNENKLESKANLHQSNIFTEDNTFEKNVSVSGEFKALNDRFKVWDTYGDCGVEIGDKSSGNTSLSYIDFHTDGQVSTDYNARIMVNSSNVMDIYASGGVNINGKSMESRISLVPCGTFGEYIQAQSTFTPVVNGWICVRATANPNNNAYFRIYQGTSTSGTILCGYIGKSDTSIGYNQVISMMCPVKKGITYYCSYHASYHGMWFMGGEQFENVE